MFKANNKDFRIVPMMTFLFLLLTLNTNLLGTD